MRGRIKISLDPEYIPWEESEDVVKLRRSRPKWLAFVPFVVLAAFGFWSWRGMPLPTLPSKTPPPSMETATSPVATPLPPAPTALPASVEIGMVALIRGDEIVKMNCTDYRVLNESEILSMGNTARGGAVVSVPRKKVEVWCDGIIIQK